MEVAVRKMGNSQGVLIPKPTPIGSRQCPRNSPTIRSTSPASIALLPVTPVMETK